MQNKTKAWFRSAFMPYGQETDQACFTTPRVCLRRPWMGSAQCLKVEALCSQVVCSFVCYQTCKHDILKTIEPIMMQSRINHSWGKGKKQSTLGVRRSKVKVTGGQRYIWRPFIGIIFDPVGLSRFSSLYKHSLLIPDVVNVAGDCCWLNTIAKMILWFVAARGSRVCHQSTDPCWWSRKGTFWHRI